MKLKCPQTLFIVLLSSLLVIGCTKKIPLSHRVLNQLSPEDRYFLATFLRVLLFSDDFSYLLFGSKPIAVAGFEKSPSIHFSRHFLSGLDFKIRKGLEIFMKVQPLFASKNIVVQLVENDDHLVIFMINKKNLLKTLEQHIEDFKRVLNPEITVQNLFKQIVETTALDRVIKCHEALFGILLGYGRGNAWLFHQKKTLFLKMNELEFPFKRDESLEKKFAEIIQKQRFSARI